MRAAVRRAQTPPHRLSGALDGVAHELVLLQARMLRMQDACCGPTPGAGLDPGIVRELQGLDLLAQRLDGLSRFVLDVIESLPADPGLDLEAGLRALPLGDLAERLGARAAGLGVAADPDDAGSGGFDLF